ncbi:hypothetical protein, partial [Rhizobium phaseoli]|uniref:hypothetical protein n=1 Tax=Rhizobium phaseoli TaxID=396 RepID=UPI001436787C
VLQDVFAHVGVEDAHASGDIGEQCNHPALTIAKLIEGNGFSIQVDQQALQPEVIAQILCVGNSALDRSVYPVKFVVELK